LGQRFFSRQCLDASRLPLGTATAHFVHPDSLDVGVGLVGHHLKQAIRKLGSVFITELHGLGKDLVQGRHWREFSIVFAFVLRLNIRSRTTSSPRFLGDFEDRAPFHEEFQQGCSIDHEGNSESWLLLHQPV
jgi:hypothetical protein